MEIKRANQTAVLTRLVIMKLAEGNNKPLPKPQENFSTLP
jgi:hypothetical protein